MASTYTSRIRLEKQADGENPNSWGLILNQNVIDLIDESIAGYETVSVSSVAVNLTNNNGATDQSRNFGLKVMGTLTANVTIGIPAQEKIYFIHNGTSGDYDLFIKPITNSFFDISLNKKLPMPPEAPVNKIINHPSIL